MSHIGRSNWSNYILILSIWQVLILAWIIILVIFNGFCLFLTFLRLIFVLLGIFFNGSFLNINNKLWYNKPYKSTELSFFIKSELLLQAFVYPLSDFLQFIRMNWEFDLITKLVNIRNYVIKYCSSSWLFRELVLLLKVLFLDLLVLILVFS